MRFVLIAWLMTRLLVLAVLLGTGHQSALANWDGAWYGTIVRHGYEYLPDGRQHNVAFFPLLPMLAWPLLRAGIGWPVAAAIVSNLSFLGALVVLQQLARKHYDGVTARWCVALACLLPGSLFCSIAYPQALFMVASALALYLFDRAYYPIGGIAAACASAASGLGIPLVAALALEGVLRRKPYVVASALIGVAGVGSFMLYCQIHFSDALAFVHAQLAWRHRFGFDAWGWADAARSLASVNGIRQNVMMFLVPGGVVMVLLESRRLGRTMTIYALGALALLLFSGSLFSVDRNAYAIVPVVLAFGAMLRRVPLIGYPVLALSALLLIVDAGRFAHFQWVAYVPLSAPT